MKQLLQNIRTGELRLEEVPAPALLPGGIVVRNHFSLVSAGTERATLAFGRQNLVGKARARPDLVRQVLSRANTGGIIPTFQAVMQRLNDSMPLGYSCVGEVLESAEGLPEVRVGDLVACAGAGYANHAEIVYVPRNLVARLPESLAPRSGAFATLGAIALQGIRRAELTPGEKVAVIGLGLVGQLTLQLLDAYGFPALGLDVNPRQVESARHWGIGEVAVIDGDATEDLARTFSGGHGLDAVIITASTKSNDPVTLAGRISRERGRVSVVGDVGMDVPRRLYYERELDLRVSRSYGPGRYDPIYEEQGVDYPLAYARWTEQRNMAEFLRLAAARRIDLERMVTHTFPIDRAQDAYRLILENPGDETFLGVLLEYPQQAGTIERQLFFKAASESSRAPTAVRVGVIGSGAFAQSTLLPALAKLPQVRLQAIASATGRNAVTRARKYGCDYATTDYQNILRDGTVNLVVIATRHGLHAPMTIQALQAGKDVFVEKPLAINQDELADVIRAANKCRGKLMVGFNRRFAPMALQLKKFLTATREPMVINYRVNAGYVAPDHWVHDPAQGGGRIIGEVCHFVDFLTFLTGSLPTRVWTQGLPNNGRYRDDNIVAGLDFASGSKGTITYVANGDSKFPKERVEAFSGGVVGVLDDFRRLELVANGKSSWQRSRLAQDKGHLEELKALVASITEADHGYPIPMEQLVSTTLSTFVMVDSLVRKEAMQINTEAFISSALSRTAPDPI
jgi:predicted dehydrogenase/threonine dehydrogenase-like Zn-dependent dehydrogenase